MPRPHNGDDDQDAPAGHQESGGTAKRPGWHAGRLPRMPREASDDEPDWVTGWFHERLLDGLSEDPAPVSDDRPDHEADREDPPERQRP